MPCNDVTEVLRLTLDREDRVISYSLSKLSCGGAVPGRSLIRKWVKHQSVADILQLDPKQIVDDIRVENPIEEYLHLKHLFAIQMALTTFLGGQAGRPNDACVINTVSNGPDGTELLVELKVNVLTDKIKACGLCDTCGTDESIPPPSEHRAG
jgi:hypothetical protein